MRMKDFAFDRMNYILIAIGMAVVILGFVLMSGAGSDETQFNPDIFSTLRVKVAPVTAFLGFVFIIYGIMHHPKQGTETERSE
ncbi:MAG: DUF3098 domain-containing protein [Bacteroidaceae bacterium]|nr:DUF3098 domain-containing protein [Bacteroidaceae bacterium]